MDANRVTSLATLYPPSEISMTGPFTDVVTSYLQIKNPQSKPICFKLKTTAPKQYSVRPNCGILEPGESTTVSVILQPLESIPVGAAKHKFMVQTCFYTPTESIDMETFWKTVLPEDLHNAKLRVVFEDGGGEQQQQRARASVGAAGDNEASLEHVTSTTSTRSPAGGVLGGPASAVTSGGGDDKTRRLEDEIHRLQRERAELTLKVQAANARMAQAGGDYPFSTIQAVLILLAGLLIGLIVGKLF